MSNLKTVNICDDTKTINKKMDKAFSEVDKVNRLLRIMEIDYDNPNIEYDHTPLSQSEIEYLKHVEEGKIAPLTLKERIRFTNDLLHGHNIELEDDVLAYGYEIKMPKTIRNGKAGRIKGKGRGKSTRSKNKDEMLVPEMKLEDMPKGWAALFGDFTMQSKR